VKNDFEKKSDGYLHMGVGICEMYYGQYRQIIQIVQTVFVFHMKNYWLMEGQKWTDNEISLETDNWLYCFGKQ